MARQGWTGRDTTEEGRLEGRQCLRVTRTRAKKECLALDGAAVAHQTILAGKEEKEDEEKKDDE